MSPTGTEIGRAVPVAADFGSEPGYDVVVTQEVVGGVRLLVARHPALQGCFAQGLTFEEAISNLAAVRQEYLTDMADAGVLVPAPRANPKTELVEVDQPPAVATSSSMTWKLTRGQLRFSAA